MGLRIKCNDVNHSTEIMNQATLDFIRQHQDDDVRQLVFLGSKYPEVDMPFARPDSRAKDGSCETARWASMMASSIPSYFDGAMFVRANGTFL